MLFCPVVDIYQLLFRPAAGGHSRAAFRTAGSMRDGAERLSKGMPKRPSKEMVEWSTNGCWKECRKGMCKMRKKHVGKNAGGGFRRRGFRRGSLTVEAAWSVPLFFLCVVTLVCMMQMYEKTADRVVKLQQTAEQTGAAVSLAGSGTASVIDLNIPFLYKPRFYPAPLPGVLIGTRARVHAWTGREAGDGEGAGSDDASRSRLVYVTENQSVYHTHSGCSHLDLTVLQVSSDQLSYMRNENGGKYHPCEKCVGKQEAGSVVYVSPQGDCYHNSETCSGLTRNVRMIPETEIDGLPECSRCRAMDAAEEN